MKYDTNGNELWVKRFRGPGKSQEYPHGLTVTSDGNVYLTGTSNGDYCTLKYDNEGTLIWFRSYNGPGNDFDGAVQIVIDESENVYVTGESVGAGTGLDVATVKYSSSGEEIWVKRYNNEFNPKEQGIDIAIDLLGNVYVSGISYKNSFDADFVTLKYTAAGEQEWVRTFTGVGNGSDIARAIAVDATGNCYITGLSSSSSGDADYLTIAYNKSGAELWIKRYDAGSALSDEATAISVDRNGSIYICGIANRSGGSGDIVTLKYQSPARLTVNAGDDKTYYLGYDPNCLTLNADARGGYPPYTFSWGSDKKDRAEVIVCPQATTTYKVVVTDASGDVATDNIKIDVTDVRCGHNKVLVCHHGKELCIDKQSVPHHLEHGDRLGNK
ncbi:MAG: hypothetical protein EOO00_12835, partial [Chitinophagaceae bacterium]